MGRGRGSQLEAAFKVVRRLHAHPAGATLAELAEETELSERTVRRYLADVASVYFPIISDVGDDGRRRWRFRPGTRFTLALSPEEALLLARLRPVMSAACKILPLGPLADQVLGRIQAAVPASYTQAMDRMVERFGVAAPAGAGKVAPQVWSTFDEAAQSGRALAVRYRSLSKTAERRFDPYLLFVAEGTPYAYGLDHHHQEARVLALDRVRAVHRLDARFHRPATPAQSFVSGLYRGYAGAPAHPIVLRAKGRAARLLERPETPDTQVEHLPGGEVRVRFTAPDVPPLRGRILSLGSEVVVESPQFLAQAIAESARAIAARYRAPKRVEKRRSEAGGKAARRVRGGGKPSRK